MYKNQLQELAQRSCFSLPSYVCTREGPDHAPCFRAAVTFNGETFEGPSGCTTLRQAEHAAAEVALARLALRGPSTSLAARVLDETGVYKNLLQETAHRAGLKLPAYTTVRSGPGHSPVFASTVELAGMSFAGDPARTKKQAEKNAAMAAWSSLKRMPEARKEPSAGDEQDHVIVARVLAALKPRGDVRDGKAAAPPLPKQCGTGSSPSALPHPSLYRHQWRPRNTPSQPPRTAPPQPPPPVGPRILPPLHLLQQSASSSMDAAAAELVRMLERAIVRDRAAAETLPPPPCYYAPAAAYHHGAAPRSFAAGGFHAPAVSVRSVIPVCAAPPPRPPAKEGRNGPATSSDAGRRV
ncbi:double-stranded RNA binding motif family protein [Panicum miliaceum]|uniref:Double-stranded RNA binding motif family protein n=1 Tax=Panicum miliaceum TaxID=4540 RepID=A0A3L6T5W1_PANMI|nr:double-stranded RNA binding motif family protein [Panicum miliaceum]